MNLKYIIQKTIQIISLFLLAVILFTACSDAETNSLNAYKDNMSGFFDRVTALNESINAIDPKSSSAHTELLGYLDELGLEFETLRSFEIPAEFDSITDITTDAADSMQKAVQLYHTAYDGQYDAAAEADAYNYYERAGRCVRVIIQVLHGESPSVDGVTYQ